MPKKTISQVENEIEQIDQLLLYYADLLAKARETAPGRVEMAALASVLHSFYNGLENIFLSIARGLDGTPPSGEQWHRDLLNRMALSTENRSAVVPTEMIDRLSEYQGFRHFYRHSYSFLLKWEKLKELVEPLPELWIEVKGELQGFIQTLSEDRRRKMASAAQPDQDSAENEPDG